MLVQMYEVQQGMAQARDENEELRIRAQEMQAGAKPAPSSHRAALPRSCAG